MPLFTRIDSSSDEFVTAAPSEHQDEKNSLQIQRREPTSATKGRTAEKGNNDDDNDNGDDDDEEVEEGSSSPGGSVGFLQLLQAMSAVRVQAASDNERPDGILGLLAQLGMITREFEADVFGNHSSLAESI